MVRVILWSSHRCASTAVERSMRELEKVKVIHEPNCLAFFCEDGSLRNEEDPMFETKREYVLSQSRRSQSEGCEHVFIKDLAYYVRGSLEQFVQGEFASFTHTFLIRSPTAVAASLQRVVKAQDGKLPFFTDTLGFKELYNLYELVQKNINSKPTVISAEDIFEAPRETLEMYCRETNLPFSKSMLTWEPKVFPEWKQYPNNMLWFESLMASRGFVRHTGKQTNSTEQLLPELEVAVKKALPYYEKLDSLRNVPIKQVA